jgi:Family of unknown function (DUF5302)
MAAGQSKGSADKAGQSKGSADKARSDNAGSEKTGRDASADPGEMDDLKRKFREALDRKNDRHTTASAEGTQATGKVHDVHGPASSRRSFRRKSGG